jgi:hypothetical protein
MSVKHRIRSAPTTHEVLVLQYQSRDPILVDSVETLYKRDTSPPQRLILKGFIMAKAMVLGVSAVLSLTGILTSGAVAQSTAHMLPKVEKVTVNAPVTLTDNGDSWTLDNGIVKLAVAKRDGNISALIYHGVSIITRGREWEQTPSGTVTSTVTIDPATNGGERAEVAV